MRRWLHVHSVGVVRTIALANAALCFWRAWAIEGSPEASVILGCVGFVLLVVASADVDLD